MRFHLSGGTRVTVEDVKAKTGCGFQISLR